VGSPARAGGGELSTAPIPRPFAIDGPLPQGITVLEASAGTGKTYAIAGLAARYVADGLPLDRMLLVTFTRMATGELRDRVRERLTAVERGLRARLAGGEPCEDRVVELLAARPPADGAAAAEHLSLALADFDAATIATTHGFCQEMLAQLGVAGELESDVELVEDPADLLEEVLDDLYVRRFHREEAPQISRREALAIARSAALDHPGVELVPGHGEPGATRARLADAVRRELDRRKHRLRVMTYDDLLLRLDGALRGAGGGAVAARLRERYGVVLVDEFQDTDPVQWSILERAFGGPETTLVLIADPKQAIYAFRGADVYAYLAAAAESTRIETLDVNWRSDQLLLDAYDTLLHDAQLGHPGIVYRRVQAAPPGQRRRLHGAPCPAALRLRLLDRDTVEQTRGGLPTVPAARARIAGDLAADVVALLESGAQVECVAEARRGEREPVSPAHLAVLVRKNSQAAEVREALGAAGVPAVTGGAGSVFGSPAASHWLRLLEALEMPQARVRAHTAALTPFLGWDAAELAAAGTGELEDLHLQLHDWARNLRERGVAAMLETIGRSQALPERVLATRGAERLMTDLRHVGELLHGAMLGEALGIAALTAWLRRRLLDTDRHGSDEERSRRLESDSEAVQVLTVHRSKGLEFPIVLLPFLWDAGGPPRGEAPVCFHDPSAGDLRRLDVTLTGADYRGHVDQAELEDRGEDLRLLYVALTRARHQAVVWWASAWKSQQSALGRLLFARDHDGRIAAFGGQKPPTDAIAHQRFSDLAAAAPPDAVSVEAVGDGAAPVWSPPDSGRGELELAILTRGFDRRWRRTSYSDITATAHEATVGSEPEAPAIADEPSGVEAVAETPMEQDALGPSPELPLAAMPVGATVGTIIHEVLEATDFTAADLRAELRAQLEMAIRVRPSVLGELDPVLAGLESAIATPIGDFALREVARADRLDELGFELPLAGGERPAGSVTLGALAAVLARELPADDPLGGYGSRLADPDLRHEVRGYFTGFIDLVVRRPGPRFHIVDYKTNWLAGPDEPLRGAQYAPAALRAEMERRHYGLQAMFYTVALHRYLRWRLPDYDPARHLGGVHYAFLRGMTGGDGGVFTWTPTAAAVCGLSDALDEGGR
jgi:exodeoxyribonuclease V beta subunit